jgi:D-hexose-6-phosphate mutarotase
MLMGWDNVSELWLPTDLFFIPQRICKCGVPVAWYWQGRTKEHCEKPVSFPLCLPQIPHGLSRVQTWVSVVRGQQLTVWVIA